MKAKTKVEITTNVNQCLFEKGDRGFIDGYVQAADKRPYAVIVVGDKIDLVPFYAIKVLETVKQEIEKK